MTFTEYYEHYLTLHQNKWTRRLHVLGQLATLSYIALCIGMGLYFMIILTPFIVYPFAWSGHFFFEKNKPAAFSRPIWAKACDWVMLKDIMIGRIKW
tara:strand:- start:4226 stop:4516 length:291 start_codon:yes stop_codon:yes gene_type:complete